jgi:hypothetical protein
MNLITTAFVSYLSIASVESLGLRRATVKTGDADAAATNAADAIIGEQRNLQVVPWCWVDGVEPAKKWHPVYAAGWDAGHCEENSDCNAPAYDSELDCCKHVYLNQESGACLGSLPNPPTKTPTSAPTGSPVVTPPSPTPPTDGTAGFWYPDYATNWFDAGCLNTWPLVGFNENDRPKFGTQLECCNQAYSGQTSMACIGMIPST